MTLRVSLSDWESNIPFAEIGERYMSNPEFLRIVSHYPKFLTDLQRSLLESQGDIVKMAKCVRELMCIDMISKVRDWGKVTPEDMMKIQGGFMSMGDAFMSYENFQKATGCSQAEIESATIQIHELESQQKINATVEETRDGAEIIDLKDWRQNR